MNNADAATLIELVLGAGVLTFFVEVAKRLMGRGRAKIDAASVVQEAALELLQPIRAELKEARKDASELRTEMGELRSAFDEVLSWARMAKRELDAHGIEVPPLPTLPTMRRIS